MQKNLNHLNPLFPLRRGYSFTKNKGGKLIRSARDVKEGDAVETVLHEGSFKSLITKINH